MKKKYFLLILFFLLAMFLSGCGGGGVTPNEEVPPDTDQVVVQEVLSIHDLAEQKLNNIVEGPGIDAEGTLNILGEYLNEQTGVESTVVDGNLLQINYVSGLISFILLQDLNAEPTLGGDTISENKLSIPDNFQKSFTNIIGIKPELDNQSTQNTKDIDNVVYTGGRDVLIWAPFAAEFNSWNSSDGEEWSHDIVSEYVNRFEDSTLSFNIAKLDNEEADVASLQNLTDYDGMVIFNTHGANGEWLITGEVVPWYLDMPFYHTWLASNDMSIWQNVNVDEGGGVLASESVCAVSSSWFNSNLSGNFSNTIILNISCQSAKTDALWNVFKSKGAGAYFGFTDTISAGFGWFQGWDLIEKMREGDLTTGDAYEEKTDPIYPNATWVRKGEENLKFPKDTYTITASAGPHGSISPSGNVTVNQGSDKSFTITPHTGYSINDVLVDGSSVGAVSSYTFTNITQNHTISATFNVDVNHAPVITSTAVTSATKDEPYSYNVNATDSDGDTLTYSLTTNPSGMTINFTTGLIAWTPTTSGDFDVTVKVSDGELFDTQSFTVTVEETSTSLGQVQLISPSDGATLPPGGITFSWNPVSNATKYQFILYNSLGQIALDATDSGTSSIVGLDIEETITWKIRAGDNSGNWGAWSSTWSLIIKSTTPGTYTITASAGPHGSISPSGNVTVNQGSDKSFTITPHTGYSINDVLVDGSSVGAVSSYTFTNVTEDHTISATFSAITTIVTGISATAWAHGLPLEGVDYERYIWLQWDSYLGAIGYNVYRSVNQEEYSIVSHQDAADSFNHFGDIDVSTGNNYAYYITACGSNWETTPSEILNRNTWLPCPSLISPEDGATITNPNPTFTWNPAGITGFPYGNIYSASSAFLVHKFISEDEGIEDVCRIDFPDLTTSTTTYDQDEDALSLVAGNYYHFNTLAWGFDDNGSLIAISISHICEFYYAGE